jgi:hypothetical protein
MYTPVCCIHVYTEGTYSAIQEAMLYSVFLHSIATKAWKVSKGMDRWGKPLIVKILNCLFNNILVPVITKRFFVIKAILTFEQSISTVQSYQHCKYSIHSWNKILSVPMARACTSILLPDRMSQLPRLQLRWQWRLRCLAAPLPLRRWWCVLRRWWGGFVAGPAVRPGPRTKVQRTCAQAWRSSAASAPGQQTCCCYARWCCPWCCRGKRTAIPPLARGEELQCI